MTPESAENNAVFLDWRPNRSLDARGRKIWLGLIFAPVLVISAAMAWLGGWLVLPFAGLEVGLLWWAFRIIGEHDHDYETLDVSEHLFCWERRDCHTVRRLAGNPAWARFAVADGGTMPGLVLGYGNQRVWVGTQLGEEERLLLAQQMATVFHRR